MGEKRLEFYFGKAGQYSLPAALLLFIVPTAVKEAGIDGYSLSFFLAIIIGSLFTKSRKEYAASAVEGLKNPMFCTISIAIIFAAMSGKLVSQSGLIESVSYVLVRSGIQGGAFCALSFLICCILSMSTGTSVGTYIVSAPLLFPIGVYMGVEPACMIGAIVSGGIFGDNLAPISDTTIVSAGTQEASMQDVLRTRCFYSIPVAVISFFIFLFSKSGGVSSEVISGVEFNAFSFGVLLIPAITVFLCLRGFHLILSLSYGIFAGTVIGLFTGAYKTEDLFSYPGAFEMKGIFSEAVQGTASTIFMLIGAFMFLGILRQTEIIKHMAEGIKKISHSARGAEAAIALSVGIIGGITGVCTVGMIALSEIIREVGERFNIGKCRRANLMDCGGLCLSALVPWSIHCVYPIMLAKAAVPGVSLSSYDVIIHNRYCLIMLAVIALSIIFRDKLSDFVIMKE